MSSAALDDSALVAGTSLWKDAWRRLRKNRMAVAGGIFIAALGVLCVIQPLLSSYGFETQDLAYGARGPSWSHWLGTDYLGRDMATRIFAGSQISLAVGFVAAIVALIIGTIYGAVAGYAGGRVDGFMMRVVDVLYSLPYIFLVILLVTLLGQSLILLFLALGLVEWLATARIVRGQVLSLKEKEFVLAARSVGSSGTSIVLRHLIPNTLGPIVVYFTLTVPEVILQEAFLSYLGLGVQAPRPSLGALINQGASHMDLYPWEIIFPGVILALLLFSLNFLGDGLRDALDPQMKRS